MGNGISKKELVEINKKNPRFGSTHVSNKDAIQIQKRVLEVYPYLADCLESMLLTDLRLPDNPIVYANDDFERMTGYSKDEIVGRNCRFLQGPLSDRATVSQIAANIKDRQRMEVCLLNYRKDGTPFWNQFVLLPLALNPNGAITHYIAVQKDVTPIKLSNTAPPEWTPPEVALWLEEIDFDAYAQPFFKAGITGDQLLAINDVDRLRQLGVGTTTERTRLLAAIKELREGGNPGGVVQPASGATDSSEHFDTHILPEINEEKNSKLWDTAAAAKKVHKVAIRVYFDKTGQEQVLVVKRKRYTLARFMSKVRRTFPGASAHLELLVPAEDAAPAAAKPAKKEKKDKAGKGKKSSKKAKKAEEEDQPTEGAVLGWNTINSERAFEQLLADAEATISVRVREAEPVQMADDATASDDGEVSKAGRGHGDHGSSSRSRSAFLDFFEESGMPEIMVDRNGLVVAINRAAEDVFGYPAGAAISTGQRSLRLLDDVCHVEVPKSAVQARRGNNDAKLLKMLCDGAWVSRVDSADDGGPRHEFVAIMTLSKMPTKVLGDGQYLAALCPITSDIVAQASDLLGDDAGTVDDSEMSSVANKMGALDLMANSPDMFGNKVLQFRDLDSEKTPAPGYK